MKNNLIFTATLGVLLFCLGHTVQAQLPATLLYVIIEDSYPANQPISIDLVVQAGTNTINPNELEFECTVGNSAPVIASYTGTILPNASATITIPGLIFQTGSNFLEVVMKENGSPGYYPGNGSTWFVVQGISFPGETVMEDFEGVNAWYAAPGTVWEQGTPAGTQITAAHSGTKAWITVATGNYPSSVIDYLYSPLFPYDNIGFTDTVLFGFHHFYALADTNDRAFVEYSLDSGATWGLLGTAGDPLGSNWYGHPAATGFNAFYNTTQGWQYAAYKLTHSILGVNGVLQFRFVFTSDASGTADGWAIDDVTLKPYKPLYDAGIVDVFFNYKPPAPFYLFCMWPSTMTNFKYPVNVRIKNFGTETLTTIPLNHSSNFVAGSINEVWYGTLPPGATVWFQFQTGYMPIPGTQKLSLATMLSSDMNPLNNGFQIPMVGVSCSTNPPDISIEEITANDNEPSLLVYPNPTSSKVHFEMEESSENINTIELYDIHGRQVAVSHPHSHTAVMDIVHLANGIYLARITAGERMITRRVLVR